MAKLPRFNARWLYHWLWNSGIVSIGTAAIIFSLGTLAVKFLEPDVPGFEVALVPSAVSLLIISAMMRIHNVRLLAKKRVDNYLTLLRAIFGAASLTLYYTSIQMLPLKQAVTLFFCSPVIAALLEFAVHGDNLSTSSILGCTLTVAGVFLVTGSSDPNVNPLIPQSQALENILSPGVIIAMLAATCNAVAFVIVRVLGARQSALTLTWWYHLAVMLVAVIPIAAKYPKPAVLQLSRNQTGLLAAVFVSQLSGQILLNRGFQLMSATTGSAINVLQVLFSYLWEVLILKEDMKVTSLIGGLLVMSGVIAVALSPQASTKPETEAEEPDIVASGVAGAVVALRRSHEHRRSQEHRQRRHSQPQSTSEVASLNALHNDLMAPLLHNGVPTGNHEAAHSYVLITDDTVPVTTQGAVMETASHRTTIHTRRSLQPDAH